MKKRNVGHVIISLLLASILVLNVVNPAHASDLICDDVLSDDSIMADVESLSENDMQIQSVIDINPIVENNFSASAEEEIDNNEIIENIDDDCGLEKKSNDTIFFDEEIIRKYASAASMTAEEYDRRRDAFTGEDGSDSPWKAGTIWSLKTGVQAYMYTGISEKGGSGCASYAHDFANYVFGHYALSSGDYFNNINEIRAGDVVRIDSSEENHYFCVLGRDGNDLWTAEGNYGQHVRIQIGYKIVNGKIYEVGAKDPYGKTFTEGWHHLNLGNPIPTPIPTPIPGEPEIEDDDYVIMSALRYDLHLNIEGDDTSDDDDNVNVERGFSEDSKYDVFKVRLLDNGYYKLIQNKTNHMAVSVAGRSSSEDANIQMYYWNPEDLSNTEFQWAIEWAKKQDGVPYHYIRPRCSGLYMTAAGSSNGRNVYQASKDEEDDDCQKWFFARYMKPDIETNSLPKGEVGKGYSAKLEADSDFDVKWTFNSKNDNLPPGLSLDKAGKITGTPTQPGTYTFSLDAENLLVDALGYSTKQYTITVNGDIAVNKTTLNKETLELTKGNSETLIATVEPANATNKQLMWTSDNTDVATVDGNGKVTAVSEGTAKITASSADGSNKSASCMVIVKQVPKPTGIVIKAGEATGTAGSKVSVPVSIIGNTGLGGMMLTISTDTSLTLTDIKRGDIISDGTFNKDIKTGLVQWYTSDENAMGDGVLFTMEFEVKAGTQEGSYPVNIAVKDAIKEHVTDKEGGTLNVTFVGGNINILKVMAGDLIPDGTIAMNDVVKLARAVSGSVVLSENEKLAADVAGDGIVAMGDVVKLARFVAGAIKEL